MRVLAAETQVRMACGLKHMFTDHHQFKDRESLQYPELGLSPREDEYFSFISTSL